MPRPTPSRTHAAAALLVAGLVLAAPLARGGVDEWAVGAALAVATCAAVLAAPRLPLPALLLTPPLLTVAVQALLGIWGRSPSLDPPAAGRALAGDVAVLLTLAVAASVAGSRRRRERLVAAVAAAGAVVAVVVLARALLGLSPFLEPRFPFVNPNHLAGFSALTGFVALGLALRSHGQARLAWLLGFVISGSMVFLSLSRGGLGAFFLGTALFVAFALCRGDVAAPARGMHARWLGGAAIAAILGIAAFLALDPLLGELATMRRLGEDAKLSLWRPALQLAADHPWLGAGRGAFGVAFPAYKIDPGQVTFTHAENSWLEPLVDVGFGPGLLVLVAWALPWLRVARRRDLSWPEIGLLAGTGAVAGQNVVDFSFETLGVAIPFAAAIGLLWRDGWSWEPSNRVRSAIFGFAGAAGAAGLALWLAHPTDVDAAKVAAARDAATADAAAREALRWHPGDWLPTATAGGRWVHAGRCGPAMPWLVEAMRRNPTQPEPHLHVARCLASAGQDAVARREYRLAFLFGRGDALAEAAGWWADVESLRAIVPDSGDGLLALGALLVERNRPEDAAAVFRAALEEHLDGRALLPLASALAATGDLDGALALARRRELESPLDPQGWRTAAGVLARQGRASDAVHEIEQGLARVPGSPPLVEVLVQHSFREHRFAEGKRLAEGMAARSRSELVQRELLVAEALEAQGRLGEAIDRARTASGYLPESTGPLDVLSRYCEQAGRYDDAIAVARRGAALAGAGRQPWIERVARLEAAKAAAADRRGREALLKGQ